MIRKFVLLAALATSPAVAEEAFRNAVVIEASDATPYQNIVVQIDGLLVTAQYATGIFQYLAGNKNSAGNFVVGDTVQAKLVGRKLYVQMPGRDKVVRAEVIRQERVQP